MYSRVLIAGWFVGGTSKVTVWCIAGLSAGGEMSPGYG